MRSLLLVGLLLSVPASARVDGFPKTTSPCDCPEPVQKTAELLNPDPDAARPPPMKYFLHTGFEVKAAYMKGESTFFVLQKGSEIAICEYRTDAGYKPCDLGP